MHNNRWRHNLLPPILIMEDTYMNITPKNPDETGRAYALRILKQNITDTTLKPGSLLSENELSKELGLSRVPVREALIELSKSDIVEILPQRGSRVALIDLKLVDEAGFFRRTLECAVVRLVCEKSQNGSLHDEFLLSVKANLNMQDFYIENSAPDKLMELDNEFHHLLFSCADKERCYRMCCDMGIHFDRIRTLALHAVKELKIVNDHREIFEAVCRGDADTAEKLMSAHLTRFKIDEELIKNQYPDYFSH